MSYLPNLVINLKDLNLGVDITGTTDVSSVFQTAISKLTANGGGRLVIPPGTYLLSSGTVYYLNWASTQGTIIIEGDNNGTILKMKNYAGKYLFMVNQDSTGTKVTAFPNHGRVIFRNLKVDAWDSSNTLTGSFCFANEASVIIENMHFEGTLYGLRNTNYVDQVKILHSYWNGQPTGYGYYTDYAGDSLYISQFFTGELNLLYLKNCCSATIDSCNGGYYTFENCKGIVMQGGHFEFSDSTNIITIKNSAITIKDNYFRNDRNHAPIYINDTVADSTSAKSTINIEHNIFIRNLAAPYARSEYDIYIKNMHTSSKLNVSKNTCGTLGCDNAVWGIKINCDMTNLPNLYNRLINYIYGAFEGMTVEYHNGAWRIFSTATKPWLQTYKLNTPIATVTESNDVHISLGTGTYYYKFHMGTGGYKQGPVSSEISITKTGNESTSSVKLSVTGLQPGALLHVYRGTVTGVYTYHTMIPIIADTIVLYDVGDMINGHYMDYGTYTLPTVDISFDGKMNLTNSMYEIESNVLPSSSNFSLGDICHISSSSVVLGKPIEYICTVGNTANSWRPTKQTIASGTTANRPVLTIQDIGTKYLDTTLVANGKEIIWNGTSWIDTTGTTV